MCIRDRYAAESRGWRSDLIGISHPLEERQSMDANCHLTPCWQAPRKVPLFCGVQMWRSVFSKVRKVLFWLFKEWQDRNCMCASTSLKVLLMFRWQQSLHVWPVKRWLWLLAPSFHRNFIAATVHWVKAVVALRFCPNGNSRTSQLADWTTRRCRQKNEN